MILLTHTGTETRTLGDLPFRIPHSELRVERASHIWPVHPLKRAAFRLLRRLFGERGRVASWTRSWRGPWGVVLVLVPRPSSSFSSSSSSFHFTHPSRRVCLAWERRTLENPGSAK